MVQLSNMQETENIRIALVEDNPVNRNTFKQSVQNNAKYKLIFIATNGNECLAELEGRPLSLLPHIIFVDIEMPLLNGIETIGIAKSIYPDIHFIVLTVFDDDEKIFEAIKAGASGYLLKHEAQSGIEDAIITVLEHKGAPMSPAIARKALQLLNRVQLFGDKKKQHLCLQLLPKEKKKFWNILLMVKIQNKLPPY